MKLCIQYIAVKAHAEGMAAEPEKHSPKVKYEVEDILNNPYMNRDEVPLAMDIFRPVVPEDTELPVRMDARRSVLPRKKN